jgi:hypothetical protein
VVIGEPRNKQNLEARPALGNMFGEIETSHAGHCDVGHHESESDAAALEHQYRCVPAASMQNGISTPLQHFSIIRRLGSSSSTSKTLGGFCLFKSASILVPSNGFQGSQTLHLETNELRQRIFRTGANLRVQHREGASDWREIALA